jgi:hypothetical protein
MDITDITFVFIFLFGFGLKIQIVSTMPDRIWLDSDIINMRFEYSNMDTVSDVEYPDSDMDIFGPLSRIRSQIRLENIRTVFTHV